VILDPLSSNIISSERAFIKKRPLPTSSILSGTVGSGITLKLNPSPSSLIVMKSLPSSYSKKK
jgi:hypothetical protein